MKPKNNSHQEDSEPIYIAVGGKVVVVNLKQIALNPPPNSSTVPFYKPMCYLKKDTAADNSYTFFASIYIPAGSTVDSCSITQINAITFIDLVIIIPANGEPALLVMSAFGLPAPVGFNLSTIKTRISTKESSTGEETPPQGQGKTMVAYQDADDLP